MLPLLRYLPETCGMAGLIITSRYGFALHFGEVAQASLPADKRSALPSSLALQEDLAATRLAIVELHSFRQTEQVKKLAELKHINAYPQPAVAAQLLAAGRGNPRLMERIDTLVGKKKTEEVPALLAAVADAQEEYVHEFILEELLATQPPDFRATLRRASVFRIPVHENVMKQAVGYQLLAISDQLSASTHDPQSTILDQLSTGISLSLLEHDQRSQTLWVTPLLREKLLSELALEEQTRCHAAACQCYREILDPKTAGYFIEAEELLFHGLAANEAEIACDEGASLVTRLRESLAYAESKRIGEWILANLPQMPETEAGARLLNEAGYTVKEMGENKKAIAYYEQALAIDRKVFGEEHPDVAIDLNNLGAAWSALGENKKAIAYYEQALAIDRKVFGEEHPKVAIRLNNLGMAWSDLGEKKKAIAYYEQALAIDRKVFGEEHPKVAIRLNNLGAAWSALGEKKKAIALYEQALAIDRNVFGEEHPNVAIRLNNLGMAWADLGEKKKAIAYYEQALAIDRKVFGEEHPNVARGLNNLGAALAAIGETARGRACLQQAHALWLKFYGAAHPHTQTALENLRSQQG